MIREVARMGMFMLLYFTLSTLTCSMTNDDIRLRTVRSTAM
jgi:hypothetical protein